MVRESPLDLEGTQIPFCYGYDCTDALTARLAALAADRFLLVSDTSVMALCGAEIVRRLERMAPVLVLVRPPGEDAKSLGTIDTFAERAAAWGATRRTVVVALGGGVPGNIGGLLAALLFRGIRLVHVPTTMVAMFDSVISLKQAVNSRRAKNLFGAYRAPSLVLADLKYLETLPLRQTRSGLCEVIKNALIARPGIIERLLAVLTPECRLAPDVMVWLLEESLGAKLDLMAGDAFEKHRGLRLEYGHTIGHAIELVDVAARGAGAITHGEAVGVGMIAAARISAAMGHLPEAAIGLHRDLLAAIGAPLAAPSHIDAASIVDAVQRDNKRGLRTATPGHVDMILLQRPGLPVGPPDLPLTAVPLDLVRDTVATIAARRTAVVTPRTPEAVSVIVLTQGRRRSLRHAVASVQRQDYAGEISILVVGDGCSVPRRLLPRGRGRAAVRTARVDLPDTGGPTTSRVARLRNVALELVDTTLVAFLDDDNLWEPDHLSSLAETMRQTGARAVHAWRRLIDAGGQPWIPDRYPWLDPGADERSRFALYRGVGVFRAGDPIVRDAVSIHVAGVECGMVDMGEWLFDRALLSSVRFDTRYDAREQLLRVGEDDKLLAEFRDRGVATACTQRATLCYRLGGFSTSHAEATVAAGDAGDVGVAREL